MPKVAACKLSYYEMTHDDDPEMIKYLKWVGAHKSTGRSPKVDDLASYLKAINWRDGQSGEMIPGTSERRAYKE